MWGAKPLANCVKPPRVFFSFDDFFCWIPCNAFLFISSMLLFSCACAHTKKLTCSGNHAGGCAWTRLWSHLLCHISHKHSQVWLMLLFFLKIFWSNDHGLAMLFVIAKWLWMIKPGFPEILTFNIHVPI